MGFEVGDKVVYGGSGVCSIDDVSDISFFHERPQKYYVLTPLFSKQTPTVYVPFNNEKLVSKMQPVITRDEALDLISRVNTNDCEWIEDRNLRKETYINYLANGTRKQIIDVIGVIATRRDQLALEGKTLNMQDEKILTDAERRMSAELAVALDVDIAEVKTLIKNQLEMA